eukprot:CAMPEP_0179307746 /NCGR_PEP_ID=MMETSP0797-20121207/50797_1 /TAXON_ID=47934 /ORGANISM="Dinophysis acuminata, Strain DAEP01" /LENGTH=136 /DNA_ID=CAMNT_0021017433 /DNA_START=20 /DNA_END=426 /DNA_ORIENTATION=-
MAHTKGLDTMPMAYKPEVQEEMTDKRMALQGMADSVLKSNATPKARHPVERLLLDSGRRADQQEMMQKALVFGQHAPIRARMEREILSQFQRLPGLQSSLVGLETVMDMDETIEFEDIFNLEGNAPASRITGQNWG